MTDPQPKIIRNEVVAQRTANGDNPNQDLNKEVLQFLCLRYVEKKNSAQQSQQIPMQIQAPYQPQQYSVPQVQQYQVPYYAQQPSYHAYSQMYQQRSQTGSHGNVQATSVYLKMMPFNTTEQQVRMALGAFGTI